MSLALPPKPAAVPMPGKSTSRTEFAVHAEDA